MLMTIFLVLLATSSQLLAKPVQDNIPVYCDISCEQLDEISLSKVLDIHKTTYSPVHNVYKRNNDNTIEFLYDFVLTALPSDHYSSPEVIHFSSSVIDPHIVNDSYFGSKDFLNTKKQYWLPPIQLYTKTMDEIYDLVPQTSYTPNECKVHSYKIDERTHKIEKIIQAHFLTKNPFEFTVKSIPLVYINDNGDQIRKSGINFLTSLKFSYKNIDEPRIKAEQHLERLKKIGLCKI